MSLTRPFNWLYDLGDTVEKRSGSQWHGRVVGFYSTDLTPEGYAIESWTEKGSVQIYPLSALRDWTPPSQVPTSGLTITDWVITCEACPLQMEGRDAASNRPVYFRERWGHWRLEWSDTKEHIAYGDAPAVHEAPADQIRAYLAPHGIRLGRPKE